MKDEEIIQKLEEQLYAYAKGKQLKVKKGEKGKLNEFNLYRKEGLREKTLVEVSLPVSFLEKETANRGDSIPHVYVEDKNIFPFPELIQSRFRRFYKGPIIYRTPSGKYQVITDNQKNNF